MKNRLIAFDQGTFYKFGNEYVKDFGGFISQYNELAKYFDITIYAPYSNKEKEIETGLAKNIKLKPLFLQEQKSLLNIVKNRKIIKSVIKKEKDSFFLSFLPGSNFFGMFVSKELKRFKTNYFLRVIADESNAFKRRTNYRTIRKLSGWLFSLIYDNLMKYLVDDVPTFYSGDVLYPKLKKQHSFISSSLSKKDLEFKEHAFKKKPYKLLYVGNFYPEKGIEYFIKAINLLENKEDYVVYFIGQGFTKEIKRLIADLKLDNIKELGRMSLKEVFDFYKKTDVVVTPSVWDKQPKTAFEPMAFGTPVIATDVGSVSSYVKDKETGILVKPGSAKEIAKAIELLTKDNELRKRLVKNAYKQVKNMTVEEQIREMIYILRNK